tara:strand:- start:678 stop:1178 length:501 start_codon:yes stop_codon:yes gene_type:complete
MLVCLVFPWGEISAHDSLYHYIEIRIPKAGSGALEFSIHAADFAGRFGVDPGETDLSWYSELSDQDRAEVLLSVQQFLKTSFEIDLDEGLIVEASPPILEIESSEEESLRPGCFTANVELPSSQKEVKLLYRCPDKRLMIILNRSGQFPKVYDLADGEKVVLPLKL